MVQFMLLSLNMTEFDQDQFNFDVPQELGGGIIAEEEYRPTPGTEALLGALLLDEPQFVSEVGTLVGQLLNPSGEQYIDNVFEDGSEVLRYFHSTESLNIDRYDIAEAIRLTKPVGNLIDAQSSLGVEPTSEQVKFLARTTDLGLLLEVIDEELTKPYRLSEESEAESSPHIVGSYVIENDVVDAVYLSQVTSSSPYLRAKQDSGEASLTDDEQQVRDFYEGRVGKIGFSVLSAVHTLMIAEAIDEIRRKSASGKVSVHSAGPMHRKLVWFGKQVELDQDWVSIVAGGNASQN